MEKTKQLTQKNLEEMEYEKSSHISCWIFTKSEVDELRKRGNNRARQILLEEHRKKKQELKEKQEKSSGNDATVETTLNSSTLDRPPVSFAKGYSKHPNRLDVDESNEIVEEIDDLPFLTPTEETILVDFYATKLFSLIGPNAQHPPLRRDVKVASTAALLLRRFFLSNSVMMHDPKVFMVASAFLATKVEDATVHVRHLEEGTKMMQSHVTIPDIIKAEIHLAAGIDYDLLCIHPYKSVEGYTEDLRTFLKSNEGKACVNRDWVGSADLRPLYDQAKKIVQELVVTDIPLIASAGKIGIVSLILANDQLIQDEHSNQGNNNNENVDNGSIEKKQKEAIKIDFMGYLKSRFSNLYQDSQIDQKWSEIDQLFATIRDQNIRKSEPDMLVLKKIHKKLKKCRCLGLDEKKKKKKKRKRENE